ncbi:unnamed protein product [Cylicostephanus goldi]|uniref:Uncharacterized protein n=1 Tax=Cylicostephanus goldi TaxID=71465 RepID=A0A3P6RZX9_CYLGO|nr:unnamed protein product [Cylicostephanus goldi]
METSRNWHRRINNRRRRKEPNFEKFLFNRKNI